MPPVRNESTPFPGDEIGGFTITRLVAYQGKEGCRNPRCTQRNMLEPTGSCFGWHCALCDEPCSSQGHHNCPRASDVE